MMMMMTTTTTTITIWRTSVRKLLFITHSGTHGTDASHCLSKYGNGMFGSSIFGLSQTAPSSTSQGLVHLQARWAAITMLS